MNNTLFDITPIATQKRVSTKKKITLSFTPIGSIGLNAIWKEFGEYIKFGRSNKTLLVAIVFLMSSCGYSQRYWYKGHTYHEDHGTLLKSNPKDRFSINK